MNDSTFGYELEYYSNLFGPCVGAPEDQVLTWPQKDILLWHWKLGVSMYHIQEFTRERIYEEPTGKRTILPPIIKTKFPENRRRPVPDCES